MKVSPGALHLGLALLVAACSSAGAKKTGMAGTGGSAAGAPTVTSFTATPATLPTGGGRVTLDWVVTDADTISIDSGVGVVTGTTARVMITATTTFTLTATNGNGSATKSAVVTVGVTSSSPKAPMVLSFSATPATLPSGGGMTTLSWEVQNATGVSIDHGVGAVTGSMIAVNATATTTYTLTATNADGMTTATTTVTVAAAMNMMNPTGNPSTMGSRYVSMISPTQGESFTAPSSLRLIATAYDPNVYTNTPSPGLGGNAQKVQFFVDDAVVLEVDGAHAEYWVFKGFAAGVAAGMHRVWARATFTKPDVVLDSPPVLVEVVAAPTYAMTVDLTADVMMAGATGYELVGAAGGRIRLNGHGHRLLSAPDASGPLTLKFVDLFDLGGDSTTIIGSMHVTTSGAITIEDSNFDSSHSVELESTGAGTVSIKRNLFRSNMRQPLGQNPRGADTGTSMPVMQNTGKSTGAKVFAGNNVGAGWVQFTSTTNWTVGGDTDADSNILIGPRVGIFMETSSNSQIRRNFSHHIYDGGWSQGSNFELTGSPTVVVEQNVINHGSWPVRGAGGEFRYNLVVDAGHEFLWPDEGGSIHHNVFVGGSNDIAGIYLVNMLKGAKVFNNTIDGQLNREMVTTVGLNGGAEMTLTSNAIINVPKPPGADPGAAVTIFSGATLTADYNAFGNVQKNNYSDARKPAHDVDMADGAAAMFTDLPKTPLDVDDATIWQRKTSVREILMRYRTRYTPKAGSPLIDKGDPAGGAGNDIGAVGAGTPNAADKFGLF